MNKDLFNQLPADEQPVAAKLQETAKNMQVSSTFEWELEQQLMEKYKNKTQPVRWFTKLTPALGWAFLALGTVFLLNWTIRSLVPGISAASSETAAPELSFEDKLRAGNICAGPLAVAHNFSVALTNDDKTGFVPLDEQKLIGELRSFAWSPDGSRLAVVGNTTGSGNIYITDSESAQLRPVLKDSPLGYLMDMAWSRDGKRLVTWSVQNNTIVYLMNADGTGLTETKLGMQFFASPQFGSNDESLIFYGADSTSAGLFEYTLDGAQTRLISSLVENESGFTWSPDGTQLAYFLADRTLGEALLVREDYQSGEKTVLATLPIPKGSGSSLPDVANLSWAQDGTKLIFEFGRSAADRSVYLAYADGTGLVKLVDSAHAPTLSADGNCLAYISDQQVFLLDLTDGSITSTSAAPLLLADLPAGRSNSSFKLDQLQWRPEPAPASGPPQ